MKNNQKKIWFSSDLHLYQKNIVKAITNWSNSSKCRDFKDQYHMSEEILRNFNQYVGEHDDLYLIGDLDFSLNLEMVDEWLSRLVCTNVHFITGNHDKHITKNYSKLQKHFKSYQPYKEIVVKYPLEGQDPNEKWKGSQRINLFHYALRIWNHSHRGSILLYAHSHDGLDDPKLQTTEEQKWLQKFYSKQKTMDVGLETAYRLLGEYRPFEFYEIKKIMDSRDTVKIDHH